MPNWLRKIFGNPSEPPRVHTDTSANGVYSGLRHQALSTKRAEVDISAPPADAPIWGILMETGYSQATATLLALSDGTTSLYVSTGGGIIGGQSHENVRQANAAFIETANRFSQRLKPSQAFPVPEVGHTIFYALTDAGLLTEEALENEGHHWLSPLFYAGHEVITQLRLISEGKDQDA